VERGAEAVGRAIRKSDDKTIGTIVIPVLVMDDDDPGQALESSEFPCDDWPMTLRSLERPQRRVGEWRGWINGMGLERERGRIELFQRKSGRRRGGLSGSGQLGKRGVTERA
jgi:hypothetical protein